MKAVTGELPVDEAGWGYEIKWDGMRAAALVATDEVRLVGGRGRDLTARFPEQAGLAGAVGAERAALDGELVVLDDQGRPDFGALQRRMHLERPTEAARRASLAPVSYVVFDVVHLDGRDLTPCSYEERRSLLEELIEPDGRWPVPAWHRRDGAALLRVASERRLEGLMAKRVDSRYEPGRRSAAWRKVKVRRRQELVVGGWSAGEGSRGATFGSLLLGYHEHDAAPASSESIGPLRYAGRVGTGFTDAELDRLLPLLVGSGRDVCPFDPPPPRPHRVGARWVAPKLVAEVAFGEWTSDGRLRHPSYLGLRDDKDPAEVVREP